MFTFVAIERGPTPRHLRKHVTKITRRAWRDTAEDWHRDLLPKHFTRRGATEYGYRKRSHKYEQSKRKRFGHTRPLVWTGESERAVTAIRRIQATSQGARIIMRAPRLNFRSRRKDGGTVESSARQELTTVSAGEEKRLAKIFGRSFRKRMSNIKTHTREVIK